MVLRLRFTVVVLLTSLLVLSFLPVCIGEVGYLLVYRVFDDGSSLVTLRVLNATGLMMVEVPVFEPIDPASILVLDEYGSPLPYTYNGSHIIVYSFNSTTLTLQYLAYIGNITDTTIEATVKPQGPSTIFLPAGSSLIYFNGTPSVSVIGGVISLKYDVPGTYLIIFIPPLEVEEEVETVTETVTVTSTETVTETLSLIETTTIVETKTETLVETQVQTETVTSTVTSIKVETQIVPLTLTTTKTETLREIVTETREKTVTTTSTVTLPPKTVTVTRGISWEQVVLIISVLALAVVLAIALKRKLLGVGVEEVTLLSRKLDERDHTILKAVEKEALNISELARTTGYSKSTVWRRVKKLEKLGAIKVEAKGNVVYVELTEEGRKLLEQQ